MRFRFRVFLGAYQSSLEKGAILWRLYQIALLEYLQKGHSYNSQILCLPWDSALFPSLFIIMQMLMQQRTVVATVGI